MSTINENARNAMTEFRHDIERNPFSSKVPPHISEPTMTVAIERLIRDPSIPMERVERAIQLLERQEAREAEAGYVSAMAQAQQQLTTISRDMANSQTRSRYASLAAVDHAIRPIYAALGLMISFDTEPSPHEKEIIVRADVSHGKHTRAYRIPMPCDGVGPKGAAVMTRTHAVMSAITYARRGLLKMIFNLAEADDDGNGAGKVDQRLTLEQVATLTELLLGKGLTVEEFCSYAHLNTLFDLEPSRFEAACNYVRRHQGGSGNEQASS